MSDAFMGLCGLVFCCFIRALSPPMSDTFFVLSLLNWQGGRAMGLGELETYHLRRTELGYIPGVKANNRIAYGYFSGRRILYFSTLKILTHERGYC